MTFTSFKNVDWSKGGIVIGALMVFWLGISSIVPPRYHTAVMTILTALQSALLFIMRGGRYVASRTDSPTAPK